MKHIALILALLMIVSTADAALTKTIKGLCTGDDIFRVIDGSVISVDVQDTKFAHNMADMSPRDSTGGQSTLVVGPETAWGDNGHYTTLVGVVDIINLLPSATITSATDIKSATFRIRHRGPTGGEIIGVHAVTSPWLSAGSEDLVTALHRQPGAGMPYWLGDFGKTPGTDPSGNPDYTGFVGFTAADYDASSGGQFTITDTTARIAHDVDITQIVKDWVTNGDATNQGIACVWIGPNPWPYADAPYFNRSEDTSGWNKLPDGSTPGPEFIITYAPEPVTIGLLAVGGLALLRRRRR